ncbi:hypothetical protein ANCDUO_14218 [Ancylostoma duodenale]|uniref:Uncharacterized protein n=1 Tax=Ancylostoma duodenale TaxID=51022 RepID=A0A0C2G3U3_9BILA|nr:hypothetical protein ANCDUO_14218 [Ancylostoma duodenale]
MASIVATRATYNQYLSKSMPPARQLRVEKLAYAAEVFGEVTPSQMACLRKENYMVALVEAYSNGEFKQNAIPTAWNAVYTETLKCRKLLGNMGIEVYMTPDATLKKSAKQQVDETIMGLISKGLTVTDLWIKVTDLSKWSPSISFNNVFLYELVNAVKSHGRKVGIITDSEAFYKITPGLDHYSDDVRLWYGDSSPVTCTGQEGADFGDSSHLLAGGSLMPNSIALERRFAVSPSTVTLYRPLPSGLHPHKQSSLS